MGLIPKRQLIALASGDWHLYNWNNFNKGGRRLNTSAYFISHILSEAEEHEIPILFTGDFGHTPDGITTKTFEFFSDVFRHSEDNFDTKIMGISGNHDLSEVNTLDKPSPSIWSAMCNCFPKLLQDISLKKDRIPGIDVMVYGIPYLTHNKGMADYIEKITPELDNYSDRGGRNILLIHSDIWGARDPSGREIGTTENIPRNLDKFFRSFDLVLAGHIHMYSELWDGKVFMVGAPYQQRKSDMGCKMGYLEIYNDLTVKFIEYDGPVFREYHEGESHEDDGNYWIKIPKPKLKDKDDTIKFTPKMNRGSMARKYIKKKGIKNKHKRDALIEILNRIDNE